MTHNLALGIVVVTALFAQAPARDPRKFERLEMFSFDDPVRLYRESERRNQQICEEALADSLTANNMVGQYRSAYLHGEHPMPKRLLQAISGQIKADRTAQKFCR